jgi:hypothetical protein
MKLAFPGQITKFGPIRDSTGDSSTMQTGVTFRTTQTAGRIRVADIFVGSYNVTVTIT